MTRHSSWANFTQYTTNVFGAAASLRKFSPLVRYAARYYIPEMKAVRFQHTKAEKMLGPIIKERNEMESLSHYDKPQDTIEWIRDAMTGEEKKGYHSQALLQLGISAAAIQKSGQTATAVIHNLAAYPEYQGMLRAEAREVLNAASGGYTVENMIQFKKLDSLIKESQRMDPITVMSLQRKALKGFTLSDGTYIPKDTVTIAASKVVSADPANYANPDQFDGLRFYNPRHELPELQKISQFYSISKSHLHFGARRHACPGRWFASHEIKLIILTFMENYEIKLKEGEGRPKNLRHQNLNAPNPNGENFAEESAVSNIKEDWKGVRVWNKAIVGSYSKNKFNISFICYIYIRF